MKVEGGGEVWAAVVKAAVTESATSDITDPRRPFLDRVESGWGGWRGIDGRRRIGGGDRGGGARGMAHGGGERGGVGEAAMWSFWPVEIWSGVAWAGSAAWSGASVEWGGGSAWSGAREAVRHVERGVAWRMAAAWLSGGGGERRRGSGGGMDG